jgi:hypothetical protein
VMFHLADAGKRSSVDHYRTQILQRRKKSSA